MAGYRAGMDRHHLNAVTLNACSALLVSLRQQQAAFPSAVHTEDRHALKHSACLGSNETCQRNRPPANRLCLIPGIKPTFAIVHSVSDQQRQHAATAQPTKHSASPQQRSGPKQRKLWPICDTEPGAA